MGSEGQSDEVSRGCRNALAASELLCNHPAELFGASCTCMHVKRRPSATPSSGPHIPASHNMRSSYHSDQARMAPKNIFIVGAQSTGKTTLVNALKDHFTQYREQNIPEPLLISEVARSVLRELDIDRHAIATSPAKSLKLQTAILNAQYELETAAVEQGIWYISDRSGADPIVYAGLSVSGEAASDLLASKEWLKLESHMKDGLVFVCEAGCTWLVDDGVRWMPEDLAQWHRFDQAFRDLLAERGIDYQVVPKDAVRIGERVEMVLREA